MLRLLVEPGGEVETHLVDVESLVVEIHTVVPIVYEFVYRFAEYEYGRAVEGAMW